MALVLPRELHHLILSFLRNSFPTLLCCSLANRELNSLANSYLWNSVDFISSPETLNCHKRQILNNPSSQHLLKYIRSLGIVLLGPPHDDGDQLLDQLMELLQGLRTSADRPCGKLSMLAISEKPMRQLNYWDRSNVGRISSPLLDGIFPNLTVLSLQSLRVPLNYILPCCVSLLHLSLHNCASFHLETEAVEEKQDKETTSQLKPPHPLRTLTISGLHGERQDSNSPLILFLTRFDVCIRTLELGSHVWTLERAATLHAFNTLQPMIADTVHHLSFEAGLLDYLIGRSENTSTHKLASRTLPLHTFSQLRTLQILLRTMKDHDDEKNRAFLDWVASELDMFQIPSAPHPLEAVVLDFVNFPSHHTRAVRALASSKFLPVVKRFGLLKRVVFRLSGKPLNEGKTVVVEAWLDEDKVFLTKLMRGTSAETVIRDRFMEENYALLPSALYR